VFQEKKSEEAPTFWLPTSELPNTPANSFWRRLDRVLSEFGFGDKVRELCAPYYTMNPAKGGRPGIDPEVYFKMLMVGFFENLASERSIAARCADSLSVREFLHYALTEETPHHSSFTIIRQRLGQEVYESVFGLSLVALKGKKLLKGKRLAIDSSVLEANASLRSLEHRMTKEAYWDYVKRLAAKAGVDSNDPKEVRRFDRKRKGRKTSNKDWKNPHDPDAKVAPDKKRVTRMLYKPEHAVDMDTGAIVDVQLQLGDHPDAKNIASSVAEIEERMNMALGNVPEKAVIEVLAADMGYYDLKELAELQARGIRTAVADPVRNRKLEKLSEEKLRTLRRAKRTLRSESGRALMRRRGELCERSFEHVLDEGGARRTTLKGRENIFKRYLIQAACMNISLIMRTTTGIGTLKQTWAASTEAFAALIALIHRILSPVQRSNPSICPWTASRTALSF
jgi:transposase